MMREPEKQICPTCQQHTLAPSAVGLMCPGCGQIVHLKSPSPHRTAPGVPALVNHRQSSHYRKRLEQRLAALDVPELPAPEEEAALPAHTQPLELIAPQAHVRAAPEPHTAPPVVRQTDSTTSSLGAQPSVHPAHQAAAAQAELLLASAEMKPKKSFAPFKHWGMIIASLILMTISAVIFIQTMRPAQPTAAITTPSPTPATQSDAAKRDATRKSDLNTIAVGLEAYKRSTGAYPVGNDISVLLPLQKTTPPFIANIPNDPLITEGSTAAAVRYGYLSDGTNFTLTAVLENKQDPDLKNGLYSVNNTR